MNPKDATTDPYLAYLRRFPGPAAKEIKVTTDDLPGLDKATLAEEVRARAIVAHKAIVEALNRSNDLATAARLLGEEVGARAQSCLEGVNNANLKMLVLLLAIADAKKKTE